METIKTESGQEIKILWVEVKNVYGSNLWYPIEPKELAEGIKMLTGKATINRVDVGALNKMGIFVKSKLYQEVTNG